MKCNRCGRVLTPIGYQIHLAWCKGIIEELEDIDLQPEYFED